MQASTRSLINQGILRLLVPTIFTVLMSYSTRILRSILQLIRAPPPPKPSCPQYDAFHHISPRDSDVKRVLFPDGGEGYGHGHGGSQDMFGRKESEVETEARLQKIALERLHVIRSALKVRFTGDRTASVLEHLQ
jgi:hypothetical protein